MRIAVGSDHAGFELKSRVIDHLAGLGHEVSDLGTHDTEAVDYPPYCARVGRAVVAEDVDLGMVRADGDPHQRRPEATRSATISTAASISAAQAS